jgi:outer membrane protein assembly factor BamB
VPEPDAAHDLHGILGLDVRDGSELNAERLRAVMAAKRKQWTIEAADPGKRANALAQLKRLHGLESQVERSGGAEAFLQGAALARGTPPAAQVSELRSLAEIALAGRTTLSARQRKLLRAEAADRAIEPGVVDAFLAALPPVGSVPAGHAALGAFPLPARSPAVESDQLRLLHEGLAGLGKTSYYDWLGLAAENSAEDLVNAAKRLNARLRAELAADAFPAVRKCLTECVHQLGTTEAKVRYDNALFNESVKRFAKVIDLVLTGEVTTHDQIDYLAVLGTRDHGLRLDEVRQCLASRMCALDVTIQLRPRDVRFRTELTRLAEAAERQAERNDQRQRLLDRYGWAVRRRHLYEAESLLGQLEEAGIVSDTEMGDELHHRLAKVRQELRTIDADRGDPAALKRYAAVLAECPDCSEAWLALRTLKPAKPLAPTTLEVSNHHRYRQLTWRGAESSAEGCLFQIQRSQTTPTAAEAGQIRTGPRTRGPFELIYEGPESSFVDRDDVRPGTLLEYTVRAVLKGSIRVVGKVVHEYEVASEPSAPASILIWEEVQGLQILLGAQAVSLRFTAPLGCRQVLTERWVGGPEDHPNSPILLTTKADEVIDDADLAPATTYSYRVYCVYDDRAGEFRTPGVHATHRTPRSPRSQPTDPRPSVAGPDAATPEQRSEVNPELARARLVEKRQDTPREVPKKPRIDPPLPVARRSSRLVWRYPADDPRVGANRQPVRSCAAVDWERRIYACLDKEVVALTIDGQLVGKYSSGGIIPGSPVLDLDGHVRIHSGDGRFYCLDADGRPCRSPVVVGEPLGWASPIIDCEGVAWICSHDGGLLRIGPDQMTADRPYFRSLQRFDSTGVIKGGILFVGAEDACVYAIDLRGARGKNLWDPRKDEGRTGWYINSALAIDRESTVIVASKDNQLFAFDDRGQVAWSYAMPGLLLASPVIDGEGRIYLALTHADAGPSGPRGSLVCLDGSTRQPRWTCPVEAAVESTPVIGDDGLVYFGDNAGRIHAVDQTGHLAWTDLLDSPVRSAGTMAAPHRLIFGLEDGSLVALECSSTGLSDGWPKLMKDLAQAPVQA